MIYLFFYQQGENHGEHLLILQMLITTHCLSVSFPILLSAEPNYPHL